MDDGERDDGARGEGAGAHDDRNRLTDDDAGPGSDPGIGDERAVEHGAVDDDQADREADAPGVAEVYRSGS